MKKFLPILLGTVLTVSAFANETTEEKKAGGRRGPRTEQASKHHKGAKMSPELAAEMKKVISEYKADPTEENKAKLAEFFGKMYDKHMEARKKRLEDLKKSITELEESINNSDKDAAIAKRIEMVTSGKKGGKGECTEGDAPKKGKRKGKKTETAE